MEQESSEEENSEDDDIEYEDSEEDLPDRHVAEGESDVDASSGDEENPDAKASRVEIKVVKRPVMPYMLNNPEWHRCPSCVSYFHENEGCRVLCCNALLHQDCLDKSVFMLRERKCPICRNEEDFLETFFKPQYKIDQRLWCLTPPIVRDDKIIGGLNIERVWVVGYQGFDAVNLSQPAGYEIIHDRNGSRWRGEREYYSGKVPRYSHSYYSKCRKIPVATHIITSEYLDTRLWRIKQLKARIMRDEYVRYKFFMKSYHFTLCTTGTGLHTYGHYNGKGVPAAWQPRSLF